MSSFQKFPKESIPEVDKHRAEVVYHKFMIHYYECADCIRLAAKGKLCGEGEGLYTSYKNMLALETSNENE